MKHELLKPMLAGGLAALLLVGATAAAHAATSITSPSVVARNQKLDDGHVTLDYAFLPMKGYAVVYASNKEGKPINEALGHIELPAGDHRNVKIKLSSELPRGTQLWVSLYSDKDGKAGFDRQGDASFWADNLPSANQIVVQ